MRGIVYNLSICLIKNKHISVNSDIVDVNCNHLLDDFLLLLLSQKVPLRACVAGSRVVCKSHAAGFIAHVLQLPESVEHDHVPDEGDDTADEIDHRGNCLSAGAHV